MENNNWQLNAKGDFTQIKYGSPSSFWSSGLQRRLDKILRIIDFKDKFVLDMGCGTGMFMNKFEELGARVYGFDVDAKKIEIAKKSFQHAVVSASEKLPYQDNYFDVIWSHEVLEHVDNDKKSVEEAIRVLKPGGKLIIFTPNKLWPFETHGIYWKGKYYFGNIPLVTWLPDSLYKKLTPHVRNYTNKQIRRLFYTLPAKIVIHKHVFPGFDQIANKSPLLSKIVKAILYPLENTFLHNFGLSHYIIVEKV